MKSSWSQSYAEDQADRIAEELLEMVIPSPQEATVLALQGDLGAGKTTLTKALAKKLGIQETVISPTFVIAKFYDLSSQASQDPRPFDRLVHIDAYRIEDLNELAPLGWQALLQQPKTLVVVEWPERIAEALPENAQQFIISHDGEQRTIEKIA